MIKNGQINLSDHSVPLAVHFSQLVFGFKKKNLLSQIIVESVEYRYFFHKHKRLLTPRLDHFVGKTQEIVNISTRSVKIFFLGGLLFLLFMQNLIERLHREKKLIGQRNSDGV